MTNREELLIKIIIMAQLFLYNVKLELRLS